MNIEAKPQKSGLSPIEITLLLTILVVAALLRFWNFSSLPFMHDEFSALSRTSYDNFIDLLRDGVMLNDSHPAGVQVFLYYMVKIFGWSEFWLKMPFTILGIASVYLVFKIGQQWFNTNVGLISCSLVAVSELFVHYSQLARPYSFGLFFILLFVFFWNKILFDEQKPKISICIGFAISSWLAAEMHAFSMAEAGMIFLTGLFFLKENRSKYYWWSGIGAVLLYAPTIPIFYHQLFVKGGIGGWLAQPEMSFVLDFFNYVLNDSWMFIFVIITVIALPFVLDKKNEDKKISLRIVGAVWFVAPLVLAFVYSLMKEPIIQYSTLCFSLPFLIIVCFSFYDEDKTTDIEKVAVVAAVLFLGISSLVLDRQYYKQMYNQGFDQIAVEMKKDKQRYGDSISFISYSDRPFMVQFYQEKEGITDNKFFGIDDEFSQYLDFLSDREEPYLGIGLADYANLNMELAAVANYPFLEKEKSWFTTRYLALTKNGNGTSLLHPLMDKNKLPIENVIIKEGVEWCSSSILNNDLLYQDVDFLGIIANIQADDTLKDLTLVMEVKDLKTDNTLLWCSSPKKNIIIPGKDNIIVCGIRELSEHVDIKAVKIKTYLWNKEKKPLIINSMSYYQTKNNPYFLGLYESLK